MWTPGGGASPHGTVYYFPPDEQRQLPPQAFAPHAYPHQPFLQAQLQDGYVQQPFAPRQLAPPSRPAVAAPRAPPPAQPRQAAAPRPMLSAATARPSPAAAARPQASYPVAPLAAPPAPTAPTAADLRAREANALRSEGADLFSKGKLSEALSAFSRSLELLESHLSYGSRSLVNNKLGAHARALTDAQRALQLQPTPKGYYRHASALCTLERFGEAVAECDAGIRMRPDAGELAALRALRERAETSAREQAPAPDGGKGERPVKLSAAAARAAAKTEPPAPVKAESGAALGKLSAAETLKLEEAAIVEYGARIEAYLLQRLLDPTQPQSRALCSHVGEGVGKPPHLPLRAKLTSVVAKRRDSLVHFRPEGSAQGYDCVGLVTPPMHRWLAHAHATLRDGAQAATLAKLLAGADEACGGGLPADFASMACPLLIARPEQFELRTVGKGGSGTDNDTVRLARDAWGGRAASIRVSLALPKAPRKASAASGATDASTTKAPTAAAPTLPTLPSAAAAATPRATAAAAKAAAVAAKAAGGTAAAAAAAAGETAAKPDKPDKPDRPEKPLDAVSAAYLDAVEAAIRAHWGPAPALLSRLGLMVRRPADLAAPVTLKQLLRGQPARFRLIMGSVVSGKDAVALVDPPAACETRGAAHAKRTAAAAAAAASALAREDDGETGRPEAGGPDADGSGGDGAFPAQSSPPPPAASARAGSLESGSSFLAMGVRSSRPAASPATPPPVAPPPAAPAPSQAVALAQVAAPSSRVLALTGVSWIDSLERLRDALAADPLLAGLAEPAPAAAAAAATGGLDAQLQSIRFVSLRCEAAERADGGGRVLSLVSIATAATAYVIDAHAIGGALACRALAPLLCARAVTKLVHGAEADARLLSEAAGLEMAGVLDTQLVGSQVLGEDEAASLEELLEAFPDLADLLGGPPPPGRGWSAVRPLPITSVAHASGWVTKLLALAPPMRTLLATKWANYVDASEQRMRAAVHADRRDDTQPASL